MGKRYKSVSEVVKHLTDDQEFQREFDRQVADKTVSKILFALRCSAGMTQSEIDLPPGYRTPS